MAESEGAAVRDVVSLTCQWSLARGRRRRSWAGLRHMPPREAGIGPRESRSGEVALRRAGVLPERPLTATRRLRARGPAWSLWRRAWWLIQPGGLPGLHPPDSPNA